MSLTPERYEAIRIRLNELFVPLQGEAYPIFIKPSSLLTTDQLRNREVFTSEETGGDEGFFEEFQNRSLTIPMIIDVLPNLITARDIGFQNPNRDVVAIFENIQEYLSLWVEIILNEPVVTHPPFEELRSLEDLAYFIYSVYAQIKPFVTDQEHNAMFSTDAELNKQGLMGLGALMSMKSMGKQQARQEDGFVSHLDALQVLEQPENHPTYFKDGGVVDSMAIVEKAMSDPTWTFRSS